MLKPYTFLLFVLATISTFQGGAKASEMNLIPDNIISVWGDEEMCLAYHRNDFFYVLKADKKLSLMRGKHTDYECSISELKKDGSTGQLSGLCGQAALKIWPSIEDNKLRMSLDDTYLTKCDMSDMIMGIGKDPKDIKGDFGFARHAGFTIGYGTAAATHCKFEEINKDIAKHTLALGTEAAEKYAYDTRQLPPEVWAQKLIEKRSEEGIAAFHADRHVIPNICEWVLKAYGDDGWVIDGFIVPLN